MGWHRFNYWDGFYCKLQPTMSWGRFFSKILPKISQIAKTSLRIPLQFLPEKVLRPAAFQTVPLNSPRKLSLSEKFSLIRDRILPEKFSRKTFPGHGRLKFAIVLDFTEITSTKVGRRWYIRFPRPDYRSRRKGRGKSSGGGAKKREARRVCHVSPGSPFCLMKEKYQIELL